MAEIVSAKIKDIEYAIRMLVFLNTYISGTFNIEFISSM
jgi:hypothetical protein